MLLLVTLGHYQQEFEDYLLSIRKRVILSLILLLSINLASSDAYFTYLNNIVYIAPLGFAMTALRYCHDSSSFLLVYGVAAYFFSNKMVRLILLTAPIASAFGGIFIGRLFGWALYNLVDYTPNFMDFLSEDDEILDEVKKSNNKKKKSNSKRGTKEEEGKEPSNSNRRNDSRRMFATNKTSYCL